MNDSSSGIYKLSCLLLWFLLSPIFFLYFDVSNVMAYINQDGTENLLYLGSDAFSDISRMVETDCENGIDDDGDGLIDMDDEDDCGHLNGT